MRTQIILIAVIVALLFSLGWIGRQQAWISERHKGYVLQYTEHDKQKKDQYLIFFDQGIKQVIAFTGQPFKKNISIQVYPDRNSLDRQWSADWKMPGFKSECWMVASGVATRLDLLSPLQWKQEACEHVYEETSKTQKLITHELFHVYHGQQNESPDFSNTDTLDWFVEGFAAYASGQCDTVRIREVRNAIWFNQVPVSLNDFWTGKLKYGLSGSLVMYIDHKYGRKKLLSLLLFNKNKDLLNALKTNEPQLLADWKKYMEEKK